MKHQQKVKFQSIKSDLFVAFESNEIAKPSRIVGGGCAPTKINGNIDHVDLTSNVDCDGYGGGPCC